MTTTSFDRTATTTIALPAVALPMLGVLLFITAIDLTFVGIATSSGLAMAISGFAGIAGGLAFAVAAWRRAYRP